LSFLYFSAESYAQKGLTTQFLLSDTNHLKEFNEVKGLFNSSRNFPDTASLRKDLRAFISKLYSNGFLSASVDSIAKESSYYGIYFYLGEQYQWTEIRKNNIDESFLTGTGLKDKFKKHQVIDLQRNSNWIETILRNCENNGYPFATIKFANFTLDQNLLSAELILEKNKLVRIDSIIIKGNATIAPVYIYNYIDIKPGDLYNEYKLSRISSRLKELAFIREIKSNQLLFTENQTRLYLYLENKKASQFDGVIGFLPDENTGKLNITGEIHLKLQNSLQRGEVIELNWKQLPNKSQDLKIHALYPFIANTHFGLDGNLAIYRKDSTYTDVTKNLGVQYSLSGNNYIKAFVNDKSSDLQSTTGLQSVTVLPSYADISILSYGAMIHYEKLDYRLNPRKGFSIELTGSTGNRKIKKNSEINPIAYDSLKLNSVTYESSIIADLFIPLGGKNVLNLQNRSGIIYNDNLFSNELFRIGGLKSLRGFDEESIFASSYSIGKVEYRLILEQNSFLFTFVNAAYYENKSRNINLHDTPLGFGAGINFETKIGIMSVSYALGKQFDNPIYFRNGKIHFGIVNYF
jgi:hemolysin activation/secretion protein